ncbi:MAG: hypothetical protein E3J96_00210 [Sulfurovum sp.]|nr:MAG: hypothetical protein E3J96_00210 [Sulfurovum sp.]
MREIKWDTKLFKVWDGEKFWNEKVSIVNGIDEMYCGEVDDLVFLQNTFLEDKNDVEIFESDICINKVYWEEPREIGFNYLGTVCSKVKGDENSFHMSILKNIEVIGNIYENPELLEAKS